LRLKLLKPLRTGKFFVDRRIKQIKNKDFTIISNNCWGGMIYESIDIQHFIQGIKFNDQNGCTVEDVDCLCVLPHGNKLFLRLNTGWMKKNGKTIWGEGTAA